MLTNARSPSMKVGECLKRAQAIATEELKPKQNCSGIGKGTDFMSKAHVSFLRVAFGVSAIVAAAQPVASQQLSLVPLNTKEVAKGYRASVLKLKQVANDKGEVIGTVDDFIFSKEGSIFVIIAVGDLAGVGGSLVAVPFRNFKFDDPNGMIVLPGASRAALLKLPVFLYNG